MQAPPAGDCSKELHILQLEEICRDLEFMNLDIGGTSGDINEMNDQDV